MSETIYETIYETKVVREKRSILWCIIIMHYKSEESNMDTIRSCTTRSCKTFFNEKKQQYSIQDRIKLMRTTLP